MNIINIFQIITLIDITTGIRLVTKILALLKCYAIWFHYVFNYFIKYLYCYNNNFSKLILSILLYLSYLTINIIIFFYIGINVLSKTCKNVYN